MAVLSHSFRYLCPVLLLCGLEQSASTQVQTNEVPANYRGPDTYGMCAYVIGDTEYYGRTFYTSSYFKPKAEQEIRAYAQSQAQGATARAQCAWSFRESDLAVMKETDRRLIGLPGHPAKAEESNWTFHGGTVGGGGATSASNAGTYAGSAKSPSASPAGASTAGGSQPNSSSRGTSAGRASGAGSGATAATGSTAAYGASPTAGSITGGAQQSISDAKTNMVSTAASGMTSATNSAVGALSNGMQSLFHRKPAQPQQANTAANTSANNPPPAQTQNVASSGAVQEGFGFVADGAPAKTSAPGTGASSTPPSTVSAEGVVADVAGKDVIINIGSQAGLKPGSTLVVMHAQRTVNDPVTGKRLRTVEAEVGELRITSADADSASGTFSGAGVPVVGDKVRPKQ